VGAWGVGGVETFAQAGRDGATAEEAGRNRKEAAKAKVPARVINRGQNRLPQPNFSHESNDRKNASAFQPGGRK
jgi:hypothetical protein